MESARKPYAFVGFGEWFKLLALEDAVDMDAADMSRPFRSRRARDTYLAASRSNPSFCTC